MGWSLFDPRMQLKYPFKEIRNTKEQIHSWTFMLFMKYPIILLTWFIANFTNLTPNTVTLFSLLPNIMSAYYFVNQKLVLGALFYLIAWLLDGVDGRLARVKGLQSKYGAFFDNYFGDLGFFLVFLGLFYGLFKMYGDPYWLVIAIVVYLMVSFHGRMSLKVKSLIGPDYDNKVFSSFKYKKSILLEPVFSLTNNLAKRGMVEPFNLIDVMVVIFIAGPIFETFFPGTLLVIIYFCLVILVIKEVFWFYHYKKLLGS